MHTPALSHDPWLLPLAHLLLTGVSVLIVAHVLPGIRVRTYGSAIAFSFIVAVLNAIAWHFLAPLTFTFTILTLGLGALIINGVLFLIAGSIVRGVEISGCFTAALASVGVSLVNWAMHLFLGGWAP